MGKKRVLGISCGVGVPLWAFKDQIILGNLEQRSDFRLAGQDIQFMHNFEPILDKTWNGSQKVDIIIGHPKCGSSSMLALSRGKKFTTHRGEPSLESYFEGVKIYQPDIWWLENLPKLLNSYSLEDIAQIFDNYWVDGFIANADEFGNSQTTRKRLQIFGVRRTVPNGRKLLEMLQIPFQVNTPKITRYLMRKIPKDGHFREDIDEEVTIYAGRKMLWSEIQEWWLDLYPKRHLPTPKENFSTAPGVYINWGFQTPLVARKSNRQFNPVGLPMTPRELCRIQGIPDDFRILGPDDGIPLKTAINKGRVVAGNTPPYEVALWFRKILEKFHYL